MAALRTLAEQSPYPAEPLLADVDWAAVRAPCDAG
jgi:hypothetical protein